MPLTSTQIDPVLSNSFGSKTNRAPRRVAEGALAALIAAWKDGADWPGDRPMWLAAPQATVRLLPEGDTLTLNGVLIASRHPFKVTPEFPVISGAHSYARAVCRIVERGDHLTLYRDDKEKDSEHGATDECIAA